MAKITDIRLDRFRQPLFQIDKSMARELGDTAVPLARKRVEEKAQAEYTNLMTNLRMKLAPGGMAGGISSSGSRRLSFFRTLSGEGHIVTQSWKKLDEKYRKREPASFRFWYKEGKLFGAWARMRRPTVVVQELKASRNHHKGRINTRFQLRFGRLPPVLTRMKILDSFIKASEASYTYQGRAGARQGLGRALFPERDGDRPWMRRMAAALGKDLRKNLRKI
jgi:hypothetical protein